MDHGGYRQRDRSNIQNSDGTLIINRSELMGAVATQVFAQRLHIPLLVVQLDHGVTAEVVESAIEWVHQHDQHTMEAMHPLSTPANVAHLAKSIAQHKDGKAMRRELVNIE